jgi:hypothetical protein
MKIADPNPITIAMIIGMPLAQCLYFIGVSSGKPTFKKQNNGK